MALALSAKTLRACGGTSSRISFLTDGIPTARAASALEAFTIWSSTLPAFDFFSRPTSKCLARILATCSRTKELALSWLRLNNGFLGLESDGRLRAAIHVLKRSLPSPVYSNDLTRPSISSTLAIDGVRYRSLNSVDCIGGLASSSCAGD